MKRFLPVFLLFCLLSYRAIAVSDTFRVTAKNVERMFDDTFIKWHFINDDNNEFALPNYDDSKWQVTSNTKFRAKRVKQYNIQINKAGWFRSHFRISEELLYKPLAMEFNGNGFLYVYIDGHLIDSVGNFTKSNEFKSTTLSRYPVIIPVNDTLPHTLAIRYQTDDEDATTWGFLFQVSYSGDVIYNLQSKIITSSLILLTIGSLFFTLFIVHLLLFLFYRKDLSNLYFGIFNISIATALFVLYYYVNFQNLVDSDVMMYVVLLSVLLACYSIVAFVNYIFARRKIIPRIALAACIITFAITCISENSTSDFDIGTFLMLIVSVSVFLYMVVMFIRAIVKRVPGSRILGFGFLFLALIIIILFIVILLNGGSIEIYNEYLGMSIVILIIAAVLSIPVSITSFLAWRFANANNNLSQQLITVEKLSKEKQQLLETQNEMLEQQVMERTRELQAEKQKSDDLLLNILPQEVADELKEKGESKAHYYDEVSVLFTDFVNFTAISEKLGVEELLDELNINFTAFDRIMEKYGLEKIKTIGDAYLAVSGLPNRDAYHAQNAVQAALDILEFVEKRKAAVPYGLDIRIGINSGSLVAGIVGVKKFAYDIWGDTVNTAARMEQSSEPGKINISSNTYELIKEEFDCLYRGK